MRNIKNNEESKLMKRYVCPNCQRVMVDNGYSTRFRCQFCNQYVNGWKKELHEKLKQAIPHRIHDDPVLDAMQKLVDEYGDQGIFTIDGSEYSTDEILEQLRKHTDVGYKFRVMINEIMIMYFMKFKGIKE